MKKKLVRVLILTVLLLPSIVRAQTPNGPCADRICMGAYDHTGNLDTLTLDVRQEFYSWSTPHDISDFIGWAIANHSIPMIGLYGDATASGNTALVLKDTQKGANDGILRDLAATFKQVAPQPVIVRLWYEMELKGLNPWSQGIPSDFIAAYRYVYTFMKQAGVTNVVWIWSPAGNANATAYYPGAAFVDAIGFTILDDTKWDQLAGLAPRSFQTLFNEKYRLLAIYNKPLWIAELGISRPTPKEKHQWLDDAMKYLRSTSHPLLQGIMYFNEPNPVNIFTGNNPPDWTLTADLFWSPSSMPLIH